ncbi:hypothetical protein [Corynebacterium macginleyi]|uniref:hypothetical protein n=1 Tax=Corynebacterium macginleyi TaxID=38290 RepID=UPI00190E5CFA|nr:hypothetical protein [Corynebacterium macginleyi]MBK4183175.1 hypothetical protein [Corynebacterium macginleyi]
MKTLADMTPQEQAECVGMWCHYIDPVLTGGTEKRIIAGRATPTRLRKGEPCVPCVRLIKPGKNHLFLCNAKLDEVAPLYDLPRAWTPDGQPPQGKWVYGEYIDDHEDMINVYYLNGDGTHRKWESDWEEL